MAKRERRVPRLKFQTTGPTMTKQSFQAECDINTIMRRFERDGVLEHVKAHGGKYGDFTAGPADFREAMDIVVRAEAAFMTLPAAVRKHFDNDPAAFLDAIEAAKEDKDVKADLIALGLLKADPEPEGEGSTPKAPPKAGGSAADAPSEVGGGSPT